ncbi:MAG: T9SS type A sorting domain-containing protein [Bacteroidota bacterium]|nr:T9SS type A sorting domain-containing protein [Bacteroidota bacterium]
MIKKNLQFISILTALLIFILVNNSFSQWTISGSVPGIGGNPSISVADQNVVWAAGGTSLPVVWRTTNGGTNWLSVPTAGIPIDLFCIWAIDSSTAFVGDGGSAGGGGGNARIWRTTNSGVNWEAVANTGGVAGFFNGIVFSKTVPTFGIGQSDPPGGAGNPYYISVTSNGGANWNPLSPAPPGVTGQASAQNSIVVVDDQFYGFGLGNLAPARCYLTSNGGANWYVGNLAGISGGFVSGLAFKDRFTGIAATSASLGSIARTTNGGVNWNAILTGTTVGGYCTMKWIEGTNTCYLSGATGSSGAISKSTNGGLNWTTMSTGTLTGINYMEFRRVGTTVYGYAVTASTGAILKLIDVVTDVTAINNLVPSKYNLEQNYPNPFNPSTTINFSIPTSTDVSLKIYNSLGKEVASLVNEFKPAGNFSINFTETTGLTSGVYFYKLVANNFIETKKMILSK